jgi:hypothetical protein
MTHKSLFNTLGVLLLGGAGLVLGYFLNVGKAPDGESAGNQAEPKKTEIAQRDAAQPTAEIPTYSSGKHALLVGVTRYDNVPRADLSGTANDVKIVRQLLRDSFQFPDAAMISLTEEEGQADRRPTRKNIEREFRKLAERVREGDQVLILMAGHGARQPADPGNSEPDGIDELFLPADVEVWRGFPEKVPNAIRDKEMGRWLKAIADKKAHVWIIFDCCHSGTMIRGTEEVREMPRGVLVPEEELKKARQAAGQRKNLPAEKPAAFIPQDQSDYLVALYACRETETTPESPQPVDSPRAVYHGLLTYTLVGILTKSAGSKKPLTYRELVQRIQLRYAARPQGSPTPLIDGKGQLKVVLGTDRPDRPKILLTRENDTFKINAGDLHGLTAGCILQVYSPPGRDDETRLLGHVRVTATHPFESTVEPCEYDKSPVEMNLPTASNCEPVAFKYGLRRMKVAIQIPEREMVIRDKLLRALKPLTPDQDGLVEVVDQLVQAQWVVRLESGQIELVEASGNRTPFLLPETDSPSLGKVLRKNLELIYRARNLVEIANRFEDRRFAGGAGIDVEVEILKHRDEKAKGEVWLRPADGWRFKPGDIISFRIKNKSQVDLYVTLFTVGADFEITPYYPQSYEEAKRVIAGDVFDTPERHGQIKDTPPFGAGCLVMIAVPAQNKPVDFSSLAQDGLAKARSADKSGSLDTPLGELLKTSMFESGTRGTLRRGMTEQYSMRLLTWRTEPK